MVAFAGDIVDPAPAASKHGGRTIAQSRVDVSEREYGSKPLGYQ